MKNTHQNIRIGFCKHNNNKVLQVKDKYSNDAIDEEGWLCLHCDTFEEEIEQILIFKYAINIKINLN